MSKHLRKIIQVPVLEYFSPVLASSLFYCNNNQGVIISSVANNYIRHARHSGIVKCI